MQLVLQCLLTEAVRADILLFRSTTTKRDCAELYYACMCKTLKGKLFHGNRKWLAS